MLLCIKKAKLNLIEFVLVDRVDFLFFVTIFNLQSSDPFIILNISYRYCEAGFSFLFHIKYLQFYGLSVAFHCFVWVKIERAPKDEEKERKKSYCIDINGNYCAFEVKNFSYGTDIDHCIQNPSCSQFQWIRCYYYSLFFIKFIKS